MPRAAVDRSLRDRRRECLPSFEPSLHQKRYTPDANEVSFDYRAWQIFWLKTGVIAVIYFKLLERFDEGWMFWTLIVAGLGVVYF